MKQSGWLLIALTGFADVLAGQTTQEQENAKAELSALQAHLPKLQRALQSGNADESFLLLLDLSGAVSAIRQRTHRPEAWLEKLEGIANSAKAAPGARMLASIAGAALEAGDDIKAAIYARDALNAKTKASGDDLGTVIFYANHVLGLVALHRGDLAGAKYHLLESAASAGSTLLSRHGPQARLAHELLERGEQEVVMAFLDLCKKWSNSNRALIENWQATIRGGGAPDFGFNLELRP